MPVHFPYMSDGVYLWFLLQNEITITAQQYVNLIQVAIAQGFHLFPFRTEKLSLVTPMVLRNSGRVGSRRFSRSPFGEFRRGFFLFSIRIHTGTFLFLQARMPRKDTGKPRLKNDNPACYSFELCFPNTLTVQFQCNSYCTMSAPTVALRVH